MNELYLVHHGIIGQKWGVRRYQNFDGSYTQAGLKRYAKSKGEYDRHNETYKEMKKRGADSSTLKSQRKLVKEAKYRMKKDYNHLAEDKKADKGKNRYAKGERITSNLLINNALETAGVLTLSAAKINYSNGGQEKTTKALAVIGGVLVGSSLVKRGVNRHTDNQLRAYYAHTSRY